MKRLSIIRGWAAMAVISGLWLSEPGLCRGQQVSLDHVVERAGKKVLELTEQFSDVKCTELVTQLKIGRNGKVEEKQESAFDYLVILTSAGGELNLSESRLAERQGKAQKRNLPLLVTNGFATLFLVFHPSYQGSFEFSAVGDEALGGKRFSRVHFQHIHGTRSPMALVLRGREYPLELSGSAWIDAASGSIAKIEGGLDDALSDVGMQALHAEVEFAPARFHDVAEPYWFPSLATIEVETPKQHWRNIHRFVDYKRFSVSTEEAVTSKP